MILLKVIQINVVYGRGSTGRLTQSIHENLINNGNQSLVLHGRGEKLKDSKIIKVAPEFIMKIQSFLSRVTGYSFANAQYSTKKILKIIHTFNPDIVHIHCANSSTVNIYKLLSFLKENQYKTIITLHAEFMYTGGCSYSLDCNRWKTGCYECPQFNKERPKSWFFDKSKQEWLLFKDAYHNFNNLAIVGVSDWISNRAKESPFFIDKNIYTILNGVNTQQFQYVEDDVFKQYHLNGYKVVLFVIPDFYSPIKGGAYIYDLADYFAESKVLFYVIGTSEEGKISKKNLVFIEKTNDSKELAKYYSSSNLTVLLSERETFSMITAESLCCGTPIVGFEAGAPELIALKEYSEFVEHGNIALLCNTIEKWINFDVDKRIVSEKAIKKYSHTYMTSNYERLYKEIYK